MRKETMKRQRILFPKNRLWIGIKLKYKGKITDSMLGIPFDIEFTKDKRKNKRSIKEAEKEANKIISSMNYYEFCSHTKDVMPDGWVIKEEKPLETL
jgi:hypothetical protein